MAAHASLSGRTILVVEDEYIVAENIAAILEDAGATIIGPFGWADEALSAIADQAIHLDWAILDLNLHGEKSYPIAEALKARKVGFVFTTGYGSDTIDEAYLACPRCQKPFDSQDLFAALASL